MTTTTTTIEVEMGRGLVYGPLFGLFKELRTGGVYIRLEESEKTETRVKGVISITSKMAGKVEEVRGRIEGFVREKTASKSKGKEEPAQVVHEPEQPEQPQVPVKGAWGRVPESVKTPPAVEAKQPKAPKKVAEPYEGYEDEDLYFEEGEMWDEEYEIVARRRLSYDEEERYEINA